MIAIGEAHFHIDVSHLDDDALERYASVLFDGFDESAEVLPLSDFGIFLEVEEGSIKGKGRIVAAATVLYFGIGQFGDFVQGVKEIASLSRSVMSNLVSDAPKKLGIPNSIVWKRSDAAKLGRLQGLFAAVQSGALDANEATEKAIELLSEEDVLPAGMENDIAKSVQRIVLNPRQVDWVLPPEEAAVEQLSDTTRVPRERRTPRSKAMAPSRKLRVEVYKPGKGAARSLKIVEI